MDIIIMTEDNKLLLDKRGLEIIQDESIQVTSNEKGIVVRLLKDYKNSGDIEIGVEGGEVVYIDNKE